MRTTTIWCALFVAVVAVSGCGDSDSDSDSDSGGGAVSCSVPDVSGFYSRTEASGACSEMLAPEIYVDQSCRTVSFEAQGGLGHDASGTVSSDGVFSVAGQASESSFSCQGRFVGARADADCELAGVFLCSMRFER